MLNYRPHCRLGGRTGSILVSLLRIILHFPGNLPTFSYFVFFDSRPVRSFFPSTFPIADHHVAFVFYCRIQTHMKYMPMLLTVYIPFSIPLTQYSQYHFIPHSCLNNSLSVLFRNIYTFSASLLSHTFPQPNTKKTSRISAGGLPIHSLVPALAPITSRCTWRKHRCRWRAWPSSWRWTQPQPCRRGAACQPSHRKCRRPCGRSGYGR